MATRVKLTDVIDGLETQSDESSSYLNKKTGEVVLISDEELNAAEDDEPIEDFPDWQQDLVRIAKEIIAATGDYLPLPTKFDINESSIRPDKRQRGLSTLQRCNTPIRHRGRLV